MTTTTSGVEVTPTAEKNAKEVDGRVRATIMTALSKMQTANERTSRQARLKQTMLCRAYGTPANRTRRS